MQINHKVEHFRKLHLGPGILIIGNAWDAASARVFEEAGFQAIGTTSAGVAASLGYPDGQRIPSQEMLQVIRRIASCVSLPVTADIEAGYSAEVSQVVDTARGVFAAGAVGLNLEDVTGGTEDSLVDLELQVEKIRKIREAVPLVLNARTDIFLLGIGDRATRYSRTVERLTAYRRAGADCLFAPGIRDIETIARLAAELPGPLNILAGAGCPSIPELKAAGVARVSVGSGPMRAALGLVQRIAQELVGPGTYSAMTEGAIPYPDVNRMMARRAPLSPF